MIYNMLIDINRLGITCFKILGILILTLVIIYGILCLL